MTTQEPKTAYRVYRYEDGVEIGSSVLTAEQHAHYLSMSGDDRGAVRLGALPHDYYDLDEDEQDTHEDTVVFIAG